tara:strand:- start:121 stop:552 length:432 start_codon:yes stop_codon:yes gene_type:complete
MESFESGTQPRELRRIVGKALHEALKDTAKKLDTEFQEQITTSKWNWPNDTLRKNKQFIPAGNRDIVDMGDLRDSQSHRQVNQFAIEWTWNVDYSAIVHNGAALKGGGEYVAREWTKDAEKEVKVENYFTDTFTDILEREING